MSRHSASLVSLVPPPSGRCRDNNFLPFFFFFFVFFGGCLLDQRAQPKAEAAPAHSVSNAATFFQGRHSRVVAGKNDNDGRFRAPNRAAAVRPVFRFSSFYFLCHGFDSSRGVGASVRRRKSAGIP